MIHPFSRLALLVLLSGNMNAASTMVVTAPAPDKAAPAHCTATSEASAEFAQFLKFFNQLELAALAEILKLTADHAVTLKTPTTNNEQVMQQSLIDIIIALIIASKQDATKWSDSTFYTIESLRRLFFPNDQFPDQEHCEQTWENVVYERLKIVVNCNSPERLARIKTILEEIRTKRAQRTKDSTPVA